MLVCLSVPNVPLNISWYAWTRKPPTLTCATADLAVISLTVDIVALAVLPKDQFVGDITGVAHTLPTDAVSQP